MLRRSAPPRRRPRRARRPLAALGLVALLAALGANGARAQSADSDLADQFGGYRLGARGNGLLFAMDAVGFVPNNPRVFQQGLPEAQATGAGGPTNYALASLDYPGSVVGDLGAVIAQASPDAPAIPSYPVQARAYYPGPPTEVRQEISGAGMVATTTATASDGIATYNGNDLPQFLKTGGFVVHANTHLEDGRAVSQLRSELADLDFAGILTIGSVVTDIRADTDGTMGASAGTTTVSGAKFLGLDVTIDDTGMHLASPPGGDSSTTTTTAKPGLLDQITNQIQLGAINDALKPIAQGLTSLITSTVGATGSLNDLLEATGISIRLVAPTGNDEKASANRTANGLIIEMHYNPNTNENLNKLVSLIPSQQLPSDPLIPGFPINSSPQGLVSLLQQVYGLTIALVPGAVDATANPPYTAAPFSAPLGRTGSTGSTGSTGGGGITPGFGTPAPTLGGPAPGGTIGSASPISFAGDAVPVWAAILLLLSLPFWGAASARLADNSLAAASSSACPEGLDAREPPGGVT